MPQQWDPKSPEVPSWDTCSEWHRDLGWASVQYRYVATRTVLGASLSTGCGKELSADPPVIQS
jgi:hypothetical protein